MKLYLFRHASVEEKYRGCYNGHIDLPASRTGLLEAKEHFKALALIDFGAVFCSTLQRAKQTLKSFKIDKEVIFSDALCEKSWGRHEGKSYDEVVLMEGKQYEDFQQWITILDGQSYKSFIANIEIFLSELFAKNYKDVLIVTHAGVIYSMIHLLEKISLESAFKINISYGNYYILEKIES